MFSYTLLRRTQTCMLSRPTSCPLSNKHPFFEQASMQGFSEGNCPTLFDTPFWTPIIATKRGVFIWIVNGDGVAFPVHDIASNTFKKVLNFFYWNRLNPDYFFIYTLIIKIRGINFPSLYGIRLMRKWNPHSFRFFWTKTYYADLRGHISLYSSPPYPRFSSETTIYYTDMGDTQRQYSIRRPA